MTPEELEKRVGRLEQAGWWNFWTVICLGVSILILAFSGCTPAPAIRHEWKYPSMPMSHAKGPKIKKQVKPCEKGEKGYFDILNGQDVWIDCY